MKRAKRVLSAIIFAAMVISVPVSAYASETDTAAVTDQGTFSITEEQETVVEIPVELNSGRATRATNTINISGGYWTGGVLNNGGWGTIYSYATSTTKQTNVFAKPGSFSSKYWSGWAAKGKSSVITKDAAFSGNTCGYDIK